MPILPLTARTVATLRAPSDKPRIEYFDAEVPGLTLRITSDGVKTWSLLYRHHGRRRRLTLGRFPDLGLGKARLRATEERGRVAGGADPATEKRDERVTYGDTVRALYDLYKKANEKKRSWPEQRRIFENEVLPAWRHRRVQDIARRDIRMLVDRRPRRRRSWPTESSRGFPGYSASRSSATGSKPIRRCASGSRLTRGVATEFSRATSCVKPVRSSRIFRGVFSLRT